MKALIQTQKALKSGLPRAFKLNNGQYIPSIGLGTVGLMNADSITNAIMNAGYIYLDTASMYGNEKMVGEAIQNAFRQGKSRDDVFVITKVDQHEQNDIEKYLKLSLERLQLDYVDIYLVHFPYNYYAPVPIPQYKVWGQMENMVDAGLAKGIGISNYNAQLIWDMMTYCKYKPVVN